MEAHELQKLQKLVQDAAEKGTENALLKLGLDTSDPISMQKDLAFLRSQRETNENIGRNLRRVVLTALVSGVLTMVWLGFQQAIKTQ